MVCESWSKPGNSDADSEGNGYDRIENIYGILIDIIEFQKYYQKQKDYHDRNHYDIKFYDIHFFQLQI